MDVVSHITLEVSDATGRSSSAEVTIGLIPASNPVITATTTFVAPVAYWETIVLSANIVIPSDQSGVCNWQSGEQWLILANTSLTQTIFKYDRALTYITNIVLPPYVLPGGSS
jgi:hypothetical protein